jgi:uncharacterized protein YjbI with pentapeptide repeats
MQLSCNQRTFEQNKSFHWVMSASLFVRLNDGKVEMMHDCISDIMESMGDIPMLDMGMPKPSAEWIVSGSFFSPDQQPCIAGSASAEIGELKKSLNIFGERQWNAGIPSKPLPFTSLPFDYKYAFGSNLNTNPTGKGYKQEQLANIEDSKETITDNHKEYLPAGFSPLDPSWAQRAQFQGTYDQSYMEKYFPGYPKDMDWRLFMSTPNDQWFDRFLNGDEAFEFHNMHPNKPTIKGTLPGLFPRCFIKDSAEKDIHQQFKEVDLKLDTTWFFPDKDIVQLIWRGGMLVNTDEAEQISHIILGYESSADKKRSSDHYLHALNLRVQAQDPLLNSLNTQDLIPIGNPSAMQLLQQSALEGLEENQLGKNLQVKTDKITEAVDQNVNQSISQLTDQLNSAEISSLDKEKILAQLNSLNQAPEQDLDTQALLDKINEILPGVTSKDPKDLDLSTFSFNKIDEIFSEISKFTDLKKNQAIETAKPQLEQLKSLLNQDDNLNRLSPNQKEDLKAQIDTLEALINGKDLPAPLAPLPRLDIDVMKQQLIKTSPDISNAQQELHLLLSNPLLTDKEVIKQSKDKLDALSADVLNEVQDSLDLAQKQFIETYAMAAHFAEPGISPHLDDDQQLQKLMSIIDGNKDASNQDWSCLDLSKHDLSGVNFSGCLMEQVNFSGAKLVATNFEGAVLARANFSNSDCSESNFDNANLGATTCSHTIFSKSSFKEAKLSKSHFEACNFSHCVFIQPEALEIKLLDCNFTDSEIENWPFLELEMSGITFDQARMTTCTFINSKVHDCSFIAASLPSTAWANTSIKNTSFQQADMTSNCLVSSAEIDDKQKIGYFENLNFSNAVLSKANFQGLNLRNNNFSQTNISSSNFANADLSHCTFDDCLGHQAQFRKAVLTGASMQRADLMEAVLSKAIIINTNLEKANLYGVDFLRATIKETRFHNANLDATILRDWRPS